MTDDVTRFEGATLRMVATRSGEHMKVSLHGELDMACCDLFSSVFAADLTGVTQITVDLGDLEFVDSTGVQAFLQVHALQTQAGRRVRFERPQPPVRTSQGAAGELRGVSSRRHSLPRCTHRGGG
jgi:anti-anti-sigma factor